GGLAGGPDHRVGLSAGVERAAGVGVARREVPGHRLDHGVHRLGPAGAVGEDAGTPVPLTGESGEPSADRGHVQVARHPRGSGGPGAVAGAGAAGPAWATVSAWIAVVRSRILFE